MRYVSAIPAYGRDYTTEMAVRFDWEAGKDFLTQDIMVGDHYVNKDDLPDDWQLKIRYNKLAEIWVVGQEDSTVAIDEPYLD